jgi:hypothetical protein
MKLKSGSHVYRIVVREADSIRFCPDNINLLRIDRAGIVKNAVKKLYTDTILAAR